MATCAEWQAYFNAAQRFIRGVGPDPGRGPIGPIPEGCNPGPCTGPGVNNVVTAFRNAVTNAVTWTTNRGPNCPPCYPIVVRTIVTGQYVGSIRARCDASPGCGAAESNFGFGPFTDCTLPEAPLPSVGATSAPFQLQVTGGPWDGATISSPTFFAPTGVYYLGIQNQSDCVCNLLDLIQQRLNSIHATQRASGYTREDQQENFQVLIDSVASAARSLSSSIRFLGVGLGGVQLDLSENPNVSVLNPDELTPLP